MKEEAAKKLLQKTLQNKFDEINFKYLIKNILKNIDEGKEFNPQKGKYIFRDFTEYIKSYKRIGQYITYDDRLIDILIVNLKEESMLERARTTQRNFIAKYLNGGRGNQLRDGALVAFISPNGDDWRFSFVKMEYKFNENNKVKEEFTHAKRYSFLVGENEHSHTAQSSLLPLLLDDDLKPTFTDIENAFNVEKVSKEFFNKYRELLFRLKEKLDTIVKKDNKVREDFERKGVDTMSFAKKLLGQIIFLYFLQKKGWLGVGKDKEWGSGSKNFLREIFDKKYIQHNNFFNDILEPLFYEALRVKNINDYYERFNCRIPFLNGGLFDPLDNYDWKKTDINISNDIFSNSKITKQGDKGDGILDIFDLYNFTVREDEPLEREVAVDPEMLGKVFENLLGVTERKSKGAYYTPREIVHYMCQESLINYLLAEITGEINQQDIETLVKYGESTIENESHVAKKGEETNRYSFKLPKSIQQNAKLIDKKLADIRICDPAVGSGAFPVGMMNEIVSLRNSLTSYIGDKSKRTLYNLKRHTIEKCIYGVDIDNSAVEVAKLRLWLSLVVDEEKRDGIQPLPNLDYKIVHGNALIGLPQDLFNDSKFKKLEEIKPLYLNETQSERKQKCKEQIDGLIEDIARGSANFDFRIYFSEVFHEKEGFDVIIANPPYIREKDNKEIFRAVQNGLLKKFHKGQMNYFYFFFHLALDITHKYSAITFITTNYYITATAAIKLRQDIKERSIIKKLVNFNKLKLFESALGQNNIITILQKGSDIEFPTQIITNSSKGIFTPGKLQSILSGGDEETIYTDIPQKKLYEGDKNYIRISYSPKILQILSRIEKQGFQLDNICNINQGLMTGANKVSKTLIGKYKIQADIGEGIFVLSNAEALSMTFSETEKNVIKPWFKNSNINRYYTSSQEESKVLYIDRSCYPKNIPEIIKHLNKFKIVLKGRHDFQNNSRGWYEINSPRMKTIFEGAKIVAPQMSKRNTFGYNEIPWYCASDVYLIKQKNNQFSLKYILALLNSSLYYFWLYHKGKKKGESFELFSTPLAEIMIKKVTKEEQAPLIALADKILAEGNYLENLAKKNIVHEYEKQIDQLIYKLYGLTKEEINIVEQLNQQNY